MKILDRRFLDTNTPSVHASTIAFFKGHPVFSWFGGSREGAGDVSIYINNLNNNNETIVIGDKDLIPRWNPILLPLNDHLILFEKSGRFCDCWQTSIHDITDWNEDVTNKEIMETATWLPAGLNGPVKSCPLVFDASCTIMCGSSVETYKDWTGYVEMYKYDPFNPKDMKLMKRSDPLYIKEKKIYNDTISGKTGKTLGIIQPTLWMKEDSLGHAFFRSSKGLGKIYYSEEQNPRNTCPNDFDPHWTDPVPTNLDNPNSAVDVVSYKDRLFLVYNPYSTQRKPLVISEIEPPIIQGNKAEIKVIDTLTISERVDENIPCNSSELSYPYLIQDGGKLYLTYTYGRKRIEFVTIGIDED